jgi:PAS domain S-box-containing protein
MVHINRHMENPEACWYEEALKRSKIVVFEQDTRLRYIQIFNSHPAFESASVIGKKDEDLLPPEDVRQLTQIKKSVLDTGISATGTVRTTINNQEFYYALTVDPVKDEHGNITGIACTSVDITGQIRTEQALRNSENRLELALECGAMGMWEWDILEDRAIYNSKEFELLNLPQMDGPVSTDNFFNRLHPDDQPRIRESLRKVIENGTDWNDEMRVMADGKVRWIAGIGRIYRDEDGRAVRMIGLSYDLTDRKETEEKLRKKTEELAITNRELESFSYSVAHDLRTPLQTIRNYSYLLTVDCADKLGDIGKDHLKRIDVAANKMKMIIENLLKLAKIAREQLHLENINLTAMAQSIIDELKMTETSRQVTTSVDEDLKAVGDVQLISVVLTNLIGNAWKFTGRNPESRITIGSKDIHGIRTFFINDNGAGFDIKKEKYLFQPFKRLHPENQFKGTGIGLATVYRVIQKHGGRIWAESEVNEGATFYFTLPGSVN